MYIHVHIYIYVYIYTYLVRLGNVLVLLFFNGFHRRDSRGPVAAGNLKRNQRRKPLRNVSCHDGNHNKTNDGNHTNTFPPHDGNHKTNSDGNQS